MYINKSDIVAALRAKEMDARADWVDRTLPDLVDTSKNAALLQTLGIDPASLTPVENAMRG